MKYVDLVAECDTEYDLIVNFCFANILCFFKKCNLNRICLSGRNQRPDLLLCHSPVK